MVPGWLPGHGSSRWRNLGSPLRSTARLSETSGRGSRYPQAHANCSHTACWAPLLPEPQGLLPTGPFLRLEGPPSPPQAVHTLRRTKPVSPSPLCPPQGPWWGTHRERQGAGPRAGRSRTECPGGSAHHPGTPVSGNPPDGMWVEGLRPRDHPWQLPPLGDLEERGCWG